MKPIIKNKTKVRKVFLTPPSNPDLLCFGSTVGKQANKNRLLGEFTLRYKSHVVCIHSLYGDKENEHSYYLEKLDKIINAITDFLALMETKEVGGVREWLNRIETTATGSIAYFRDKDNTEFIELASCHEKIRLYSDSFGATSKKNFCLTLNKLNAQLCLHRQDWVDLKISSTI